MLLNCDLGEFKENNDAQIMPYIDMANIACGFHGSDPSTIRKTIALAVAHKVSIGAHPSYPDKKNFGRTSMVMSSQALIDCLHYQIGALQTLASIENTFVQYVKPHGALYNDMMKNPKIFTTVCQAISQLNQHNTIPLYLLIQALCDDDAFVLDDIAAEYDIELRYEAFADRAYQDNGLLVSRNEKNALLTDINDVIERCQRLVNQQPILSINQQQLPFALDTLCVHSDTPNAVQMVKALRDVITDNQS